MRFAVAYSCGKDSTLALHEMLAAGHEPVCLLTMVNAAQQRSWFHGASAAMLKAYEQALALPLHAWAADGSAYGATFEQALAKAKILGAKACVFGDLDYAANRTWEEERCKTAGLKALFPLWNMDRADILASLLDNGYQCLIKAINVAKLPKASPAQAEQLCQKYLGQCLTREFCQTIADLGGDSLGENGEYHTLAVTGPIFARPLQYKTGSILNFPDHVAIEIEFPV